MSKFNFSYMSNNDTEAVCFNKKKWTKKEALKQARYELGLEEEPEIELEIFSSCVECGFYATEDNGVLNGWHIRDIYEQVIVWLQSQVPVWVVKAKEVKQNE